MLNLLKRFLRQEAKKEDIALEELPAWIDEKTKASSENLDNALKEDFFDLKALIPEFKAHIEALGHAEVEESQSIQSKVKQVVLGHRENYIRVMNSFADSIIVPVEFSYRDASSLSVELNSKLDEIGKSTIKSYYTVQHLFHAPLKDLANDLKRFSMISQNIQEKIRQSNAFEVEHLKAGVQEMVNSVYKKKDLFQQIEEQQKLLAGLEELKKELDKKTEEVKASPSYSELESLQSRLKESEDKIKEIENHVVQIFAPLESGLRKFKRIVFEDEKLIEGYLNHAMTALLNDKEMKIVPILENMKQSIITGSLETKEDKKKRFVEGISFISRDLLQDTASQYRDLLEQKEMLQRQIRLNPAESKLKEIVYKQEHNDFKIQKLNDETKSCQKKYDSLDLEQLKRSVEEKIKEIIKIEITVLL